MILSRSAASSAGRVNKGPAGFAGCVLDAGTDGDAGGRRVTRFDSITALRANAVPVSRWQEVQWQQWTMRGRASRR